MANLEQPLAALMQNADAIVTKLNLRERQLQLAVQELANDGRFIHQILMTRLMKRMGSIKYRKQRKLIIDSGLFDAAYYVAACPSLLESRQHPVDHYLSKGAKAGLNPHPLFDSAWYLDRNPDVAASCGNPFEHFLRCGGSERRSPHPLFDSDLYMSLYPDVAASGMNPLVHYVRHGGKEGRRPHWLFDSGAYLEAFPEVNNSGLSPLEHYCRYGALQSFKPHRYFDPDYYLKQKPQLLGAGIVPLVDFLKSDIADAVDPSPEFCLGTYRMAYPEVPIARLNPLVHFASSADYSHVVLGMTDRELPVPPVRITVDTASMEAESKEGHSAGEPPTQRLQDFLYDEFGLNDRTTLVQGMQRFRLPLNPEMGCPPPNDDDLEALANLVSSLANTHQVSESPEVSIIVPVYNQVRFTLACLYSILSGQTKHSYEIIIADDCSSDATPAFFSHGLPNIKHVCSATNVGFLRNCNNAAQHAEGRIVVFLNNDTYVLPGWLDHLVETLDSNPDIGLVGSKLIFADGRLQESGGLVFSDGSGWNYGRLDDPRKPEYCYLRDTDYVSGASIAISNLLWKELGGFDECYEKAYYEDTDLAFRVRAAGKRVVVQPLSQLIHFEGVSSGTDITSGVKRYQVVNGEIFYRRWADILSSHGTADPSNLPVSRNSQGTILVVDACTPTPDRDAGSMYTYQYLRMLKSFGYHVLFAPQNLAYMGHYSASLQQLGIQVLHAPYWTSLDQILAVIGTQLDFALIYRAPVAEAMYDKIRRFAPQAKFIFNTVDLHYLRMEREAKLSGDEQQKIAAQEMKAVELELIQKADAAIVLSRFELELLKDLTPIANIYEIPIVLEVPKPSENRFEQRHDVLFVGGFDHSPNVDAVKWFVGEVVPLLHSKGFNGQFVIVGSNMPPEIKELARPGVITRGFVPDLEEFFSEIRVSVAPLRYGAGLKGKVISSLSYGVPVVATDVAVEGGGFVHGKSVLVANEPAQIADAILQLYNDADLWEGFSEAGYAHFVDSFSVGAVSGKLALLFSDLICAKN